MIRLSIAGTVRVALSAGLLATLSFNVVSAQTPAGARPDSYRDNNRPADPRYKADILLVVAHPDDEGDGHGLSGA